MNGLDPIQIGGIGLALLVAYRALVIIESLVRGRKNGSGSGSKVQQQWKLGDPVPVTTAQCEGYRDRVHQEIADMRRDLAGRLDRVQEELRRLELAIRDGIRSHEREYHGQDISGVLERGDG